MHWSVFGKFFQKFLKKRIWRITTGFKNAVHLDRIIGLRPEVEESSLESKSIVEAGQVAAITEVRGSTGQQAAEAIIPKF